MVKGYTQQQQRRSRNQLLNGLVVGTYIYTCTKRTLEGSSLIKLCSNHNFKVQQQPLFYGTLVVYNVSLLKKVAGLLDLMGVICI